MWWEYVKSEKEGVGGVGPRKIRIKKGVIMTSVCFTFKRVCNLTHYSLECWGGQHRMAAFQKQHLQKVQPSNTSNFASLLLLCVPCFPWWHFNIQYFTLSLALETCGELCAAVHRQSWTLTQCSLRRLQWFHSRATLLQWSGCLVTVSLCCQLGRNRKL